MRPGTYGLYGSGVDALLKKPLSEMTDDELFSVLDAASEEMKRRNGLLGPSVTDIKNQPVEQTVESFLGALAQLGIHVKKK